ncbi:MAG TPA: EI24 domain-containing protein [Rhizomicrobium sp.]|nr:EI24 domain-containing protein [Rhizomicrobium sp.]
MFASLGRAIRFLFDPAFFGVMLKAVALTLALSVALLAGVEYGLHHLPALGSPLVNRALELLAPALMVMGLFAVGAPAAAFFAGLYLDRVADAIEARDYPSDPKPKGAPFWTSLAAGSRVILLVVVIDLVLLPADAALPGLAQIATVLANGALLGREYFELVALRHVRARAADALRRRNGPRIFAAGLIISALCATPVADLFAPVFGAALMVHLYKRIARETQT